MRFGYVIDQLAIGGAMNEVETYEQMKKWLNGVTHIICLTRLCEHRFKKIEDVEIIHFYIHDDGRQMPDRYWRCHIDYALDVLKDKSNKLLVHCAAGRNRSTSVAYAILRALGYPRKKAKNMVLIKYAYKMYEQEKNIKPPHGFRLLKEIRYQDQVDDFMERCYAQT